MWNDSCVSKSMRQNGEPRAREPLGARLLCHRSLLCWVLGIGSGSGVWFGSLDDARADCSTPEPRLVWSSPGAGDEGVPTNADLLMIVEHGYRGIRSVELDGVELQEASDMPGHYELGELEAESAFEVEVTLGEHSWLDRNPPTLRWTFTTGSGPSTFSPSLIGEAQLEVRPSGLYESDPNANPLRDQPLCVDALLVGTCFDTGEPDLVSAGTFTGASMLVLETRVRERVQFRAVPASCGQALSYGFPLDSVHFAHGVSADGQSVQSVALSDVAQQQAESVETPEATFLEQGSASCSFAPSTFGSNAGSLLSILAGLTLLRRRAGLGARGGSSRRSAG